MASVPAKTPTPMERAGLTEVPVALIEAKWIIASARPMASGPMATLTSLRSSVTARITQRNTAVQHDLEQQRGPPREAGALVAEEVLRHVALGAEALEAVVEAEQHGAGEQAAEELGGHVDADLVPRQTAAEHRAERDGRVEVAARDAADGVGHDDDGEAEGQPGGDVVTAAAHGRAAAEEDEHEGAQRLGRELLAGGRCVDGVAHRELLLPVVVAVPRVGRSEA